MTTETQRHGRPQMKRDPENVTAEQDSIRNLAHVALQTNAMVHRLRPSEVGPVEDAANELTGDLEEAIRDAFEAMGMPREIPEGFVASASDDARSRLAMKRVGR